MASPSKTIPLATPQLPGRIAQGLRKAIEDPKKYPKAYIRLSASGGVHGESYDFEYRIEATGRATSRLHDELKGRRVAQQAATGKAASPARFAALAKAIDIEALLRSEPVSGGFAPDSVVGRLEISDGEQTATFLFQASDEPAAGARASDPLRRAAAEVYKAAAAHLGTDDVKP